ncbi:MAG: hypothetical protein AB1665_01915 [Candidatus Thermoplasmatota archaeon]
MLEGWMEWLASIAGNPVTFLVFFFIFCVLAAIILPIPVELGLLGLVAHDFTLFDMGVYPSYLLLAAVIGFGKALGGWGVFVLGVKVEDDIRRWLRWRWFQWLMERASRLVSKLGYIGLYILLMIPGMTDTVPLYLFSFLNRDGTVFQTRWFVLTNFLAGAARALMVGILVTAGISYFL